MPKIQFSIPYDIDKMLKIYMAQHNIDIKAYVIVEILDKWFKDNNFEKFVKYEDKLEEEDNIGVSNNS